MTAARDLADRYHEAWLEAHPLAATMYGIRSYDALMPDDSEAGEAARREVLVRTQEEARSLAGSGLDPDDVITVACVASAADQEVDAIDAAGAEYTVTPMPYFGPAAFLAAAARTVLADGEAARDYVARLRAAGPWIDQQTERLRSGEAKGRLPVAPLVELTLGWGEGVLADPVPAALVAPSPPAGWDGVAAWREDRDAAAADTVVPALERWLGAVRELLPRCRPADSPGLAHLPGGEEDYARAIRIHTTLPLTAEELHRIGREDIEELEARCREIGDGLGLHSLEDIHAAMRRASAGADPAEALAAALHAVRRAESRAAEVFPAPLPGPCDVTPMPPVVAASGAAPHYTPPRLDGSRPGTYWFNTELPTAGTGWDLEGVAFHEAVPGHHLQLSRVQLLTSLPAFQRQRGFTVFAEGWGLYAEQLAEEMGLYSGPEALLGGLAQSLMRAARLVVDTGLHHLGWSRDEAVAYFVAHVPNPEAFLANEVDRYIIWPGQALAYLTGKREILRLREQVRSRLGPSFDLPAFHAAVLDHGSLPMPVLQGSIDTWLESQAA